MEQKTERAAKLTIIIGANGTGKTTLLRNLLNQSHDKSLVITPDDIEWNDAPMVNLSSKDDFLFNGVARHIFNPNKTTGTMARLHFFKRGNIVFDDCRAYLQSSTHDKIRELIIRRRQRMTDVFAVGHGFNEIPPVFFTFATDIILFRTVDNIARRKNCLKDYDRILQIQQKVNAKAVQNPYYCELIKY